MANRKIYIDREEINSKEIAKGRDFKKLLKNFKTLHTPFYAKTPFLLGSIVGTIALTGSLVYMNYSGGKSVSELSKKDSIYTKPATKEVRMNRKDFDENLGRRQEKPPLPSIEKHAEWISESGQMNRAQVKGSEKNVQNLDRVQSSIAHRSEAGLSASKAPEKNNKSKNENKENREVFASAAKLKSNAVSEERTANSGEPIGNREQPIVEPKENEVHNYLKTSIKDTNNSQQPNAEHSEEVVPQTSSSTEKKISAADATVPASENSRADSFPALPGTETNKIKMDSTVKEKPDLIQKETARDSVPEKSFRKKLWVIDGGASLGIYNDEVTNVLGESKKSMAANSIYTIGAEYGISKRFGVGGRISIDDFFTGKDTATGKMGSASSFNWGFFVNYHLLRTRRFDLPIGFSTGHSVLTINVNDVYGTKASGAGLINSLYIRPRFYFGKRFGIFGNIAIAGYNYSTLNVTRSYTPGVTANNTILFNLNGFTLGFGAQWKF